MPARLEIHDKTGERTIIMPDDIHGELWIDGEYCGVFVLHVGEMTIINKSGIVNTYIAGFNWVGEYVGRG